MAKTFTSGIGLDIVSMLHGYSRQRRMIGCCSAIAGFLYVVCRCRYYAGVCTLC